MDRARDQPVGVVLAGGAARRLGGDKAVAALGGRPLAAWVADALGAIVRDVVICARVDTALPELGVAVWREAADAPRHPLTGIAAALARADGRAVLCCPVDLPFVSAAGLRALLVAAGSGSGAAVGSVPASAGAVVADGQPLLGWFGPSCAGVLAGAARRGAPARETIAALSPTVVSIPDAGRALFNVNTPADLAAAEEMLSADGRR